MFYFLTNFFSFVLLLSHSDTLSLISVPGSGGDLAGEGMTEKLFDESAKMKQTLTLLTLGVNDFSAMKTWYKEKFGWTPFQEGEGIIFFRLAGGTALSLFAANELAEDVSVPQDGKGFKRF